jgi:trk system potassium uptake protein TrkA
VRGRANKQMDRVDQPEASEKISEVIMAHHDTIVQPGDHVIIFVANKRIVSQIEKLFQVGFSFI